MDAGAEGRYADLALGTGGRLHVSYWDYTNFDLKYATCVTACTLGASWQVTTLDAFGNVGEYASIAVDPNGRPHVSYQFVSMGDLMYIH